MSDMQQKTFKNRPTLKHPLKSLKLLLNIFLKLPWNFYKRSLKLLWKILETSIRDPWNFYERSLKLQWNILENPSKFPLKLPLKHPLKLPLKFSWNSPWNWLKRLESPVKYSRNTLEISLWHPWNFPKAPQKFFETPSKFPYTSITSFELASNTIKNTPDTPSKFSWKPLEILSTQPLNFHTKNFLQHLETF